MEGSVLPKIRLGNTGLCCFLLVFPFRASVQICRVNLVCPRQNCVLFLPSVLLICFSTMSPTLERGTVVEVLRNESWTVTTRSWLSFAEWHREIAVFISSHTWAEWGCWVKIRGTTVEQGGSVWTGLNKAQCHTTSFHYADNQRFTEVKALWCPLVSFESESCISCNFILS